MADNQAMFQVFLKRAQGIGHILRNRGIWRMGSFTSGERLSVAQTSNDDGSTTLLFRRKNDGYGCIEIGNIQPGKLANVRYGEETISKSQGIGSSEETVDNRNGVADVEVKFRDLFSHTDAKEESSEKSAGTSVSVSVTAKEGVEGVAEFEQSIEAEAHAEFSESSSTASETTSEEEGEEGTTVPVGKRVRITENRSRADGSVEVTANGSFTHTVTAGKHSGGRFVHKGRGHWDSWSEFKECVLGQAPDNYSLATSFRDHKPWHADLWALDDLNAEVKSVIKFEGRAIRDYRVEAF